MKVKTLLLVLLIILAMKVITQPVAANPNNPNTPSTQAVSKAKPNEPVDTKYLGYSVDGRTSASVLAAQRSHTVAGKDERNFAIFTGIVVILMIIFFSQIEFYNK
jgi:hypothetical protein